MYIPEAGLPERIRSLLSWATEYGLSGCTGMKKSFRIGRDWAGVNAQNVRS